MQAFLENELSQSLSLDGEWDFSLGGRTPHPIPVPSAWEAHTHDKITDGPAIYRRGARLQADWFDGRRILLEADAVSFYTIVRVNGRAVGEHRGMWSAFQLDITPFAQAGDNAIELEVWKPGGRFHLRETLSGFLPDVITAFGGIWQGIRLRALAAAVADLRVLAGPSETLTVAGSVVTPKPGLTELRIAIDSDGQTALLTEQVVLADGERAFELKLDASTLARWQPAAPGLHTVSVSLCQDGAEIALAARRFGMRDVTVDGAETRLDGQPLHLRGALDWGWHAHHIRPAPTRAELARQFEQLRALGFNLLKLCLFVPDDATFEAADEAGMLLWLEMPMWLPRVTPALRELALAEYAAVFRRLHHHPSIAVLSLGCELNAEADAGFLQALNALARRWFPNVLHCDNSGSAEAYGGVQTVLSDFYDYHFYTDPHFFHPLVEHFDRAYQPRKPWLYGEFCDADTGRDFSQHDPLPWWLTEPVVLQRDDYLSMRDHQARLAAADIRDGMASLVQRAHGQATAVRKFILERARAHDAAGGYVISGWSDSPITTSGMVDDHGRLKFDPDEWQRFNADGVLLIDRERRRRWVGGDRPAYRDPFTWRAGERAEVHALFSNGVGLADSGELRWSLTTSDGRLLEQGARDVGPLAGGQVAELAVLRWTMPKSAHGAPLELQLRLKLDLRLAAAGSATVHNNWPLWVVPRAVIPVGLLLAGSLGRAPGPLQRLDSGAQLEYWNANMAGAPAVAAELSDELLAWIYAGGRALLWQRHPDTAYTRTLPFWREAIHAFEPHPLWDRAPVGPHADMRFFSVAGDLVLDLESLRQRLGPAANIRPVWRRFDARSLFWAEYVVDVQYGAGRLLASSLNFEGGLGHQPTGFDQNPMGAWLFASLIDCLAADDGGRA